MENDNLKNETEPLNKPFVIQSLPSDGNIEKESDFYATHLDFAYDKALNDKGRKRVEEWCKADFVAGAKWMRERVKGNVV